MFPLANCFGNSIDFPELSYQIIYKKCGSHQRLNNKVLT
jgi:hypothetical protein